MKNCVKGIAFELTAHYTRRAGLGPQYEKQPSPPALVCTKLSRLGGRQRAVDWDTIATDEAHAEM